METTETQAARTPKYRPLASIASLATVSVEFRRRGMGIEDIEDAALRLGIEVTKTFLKQATGLLIGGVEYELSTSSDTIPGALKPEGLSLELQDQLQREPTAAEAEVLSEWISVHGLQVRILTDRIELLNAAHKLVEEAGFGRPRELAAMLTGTPRESWPPIPQREVNGPEMRGEYLPDPPRPATQPPPAPAGETASANDVRSNEFHHPGFAGEYGDGGKIG